jgi:hypothetical protein
MVRAIQFSERRVGSTFLQNAINSHTDIVGIDEVFVNNIRQGLRKSGFIPYVRFKSGDEISSPKDYIEHVLHKTYIDKSTIFKLMYHQIHHHTGLYHYLVNGGGLPMIHIMRKNLLKQVISFHKMPKYNHNPIKVSADRLFQEVVDADRNNKNWAKVFRHRIRLTLYYEDMIGRTEGDKTYLAPNTNIAVCEFFQVEQQQLYSTTKKKNKEDISVYLPNYDEVIRRFKGSQYQWMIE